MKVAYFDCAAGIAGDMCLGALLDCGVPLEYLNQQLQALGIGGEYSLQVSRVQRCGQPALQAVVEVLDGSPPPPFLVGDPGFDCRIPLGPRSQGPQPQGL
jgi:hypothetical protein